MRDSFSSPRLMAKEPTLFPVLWLLASLWASGTMGVSQKGNAQEMIISTKEGSLRDFPRGMAFFYNWLRTTNNCLNTQAISIRASSRARGVISVPPMSIRGTSGRAGRMAKGLSSLGVGPRRARASWRASGLMISLLVKEEMREHCDYLFFCGLL